MCQLFKRYARGKKNNLYENGKKMTMTTTTTTNSNSAGKKHTNFCRYCLFETLLHSQSTLFFSTYFHRYFTFVLFPFFLFLSLFYAKLFFPIFSVSSSLSVVQFEFFMTALVTNSKNMSASLTPLSFASLC